MVERQHDTLDVHVQGLQWQADLSRRESHRFTFHTLEDNSKAWRFETEIDGQTVALVFPASHLVNYINLSREDLRERLRQDMKKPDDPKRFVIPLLSLTDEPLTPEEMDRAKELFKKAFGTDIDDFEWFVEHVRKPGDAPSDQSDIDIRFHLRG